MYTSTFGSERLYNVSNTFTAKIDHTIIEFNRAKYAAYNLVFFANEKPDEFAAKYGDKSLHMILKDRFGFNTYYTNSILQEANGIYDSQVEKRKLDVKDKQEKIKIIEKQIDKEQKSLDKYIELRNELHIYQKSDRKKKMKTGFAHITIKGDVAETRYVKNGECIRTQYKLYEFEYKYLNKKIKTLRVKINQRQFRVDNLKEAIKKPLKHLHFAKAFDGVDKLNNKYKEFKISGRSDAASGNFVFKAMPVKDGFDVWVKFIDKTELVFKNVKFPFRGDYLKTVLVSDGIRIPICYTLVRKIDEFNQVYYQFKVSIDISAGVKIVTDKKRGVIGMDFNIGHIDMTNIDAHGNVLATKIIKYEITDDSKQNEVNLRKAINQAVEYAKSVKKSLVIENLDTSNSKSTSTYRNKKINKIFHSFSYSAYTQYVEYAGVKHGVEIIKVSPAYTSYIGRVKYDYKCLNSHVLASYVIARRGLGFKEIVPNELKLKIKDEKLTKHHWSHWSDLKRQKI